MTHETTWRAFAACRLSDPDMFAPTGIEDVSIAALMTCRTCPVREVCHERAQAEGFDQWCIHGGELPNQWAFKGARVSSCGHCARALVVGARAHAEEHYCDNRCRFRHRHEVERAAHGEINLFDLLAEVVA